jgi:hypothetical protein
MAAQSESTTPPIIEHNNQGAGALVSHAAGILTVAGSKAAEGTSCHTLLRPAHKVMGEEEEAMVACTWRAPGEAVTSVVSNTNSSNISRSHNHSRSRRDSKGTNSSSSNIQIRMAARDTTPDLMTNNEGISNNELKR